MTATDPGAKLAFDLAAHVDASIGPRLDAQARLSKRTNDLLRRPPAEPVSWRPTQVKLNTGSFLVFKLGGPDQGQRWYVRSIVVSGTAPTSVVAGRADVFVSATDYQNFSTLLQLGVQDWRDQAPSLPMVAFYTRGALVVQANEDLYVVVSNGTTTAANNANQYVVSAQVENIEDADYPESFSI